MPLSALPSSICGECSHPGMPVVEAGKVLAAGRRLSLARAEGERAGGAAAAAGGAGSASAPPHPFSDFMPDPQEVLCGSSVEDEDLPENTAEV